VVVEAAADPALGVPIGLLIGALSGAMFIVFLNSTRTGLSVADLVKLFGEAGTIVGLWFGGSWLGSKFFEHGDAERIRGPYMVSLALMFFVVAAWPFFNWIRDVAHGPQRGTGA
jgi:hypothetical protein